MAVVKDPALSSDASGNLGAICYTRWRGLNVARDTWTGTVPNTAKQVAIQTIVTSVAQAWSGILTELQREAWRNAARDQVWVTRGRFKYIPSGYNYFVKLNIQRKRIPLGILTVPPPQMSAFELDDIVLTWYPIPLRVGMANAQFGLTGGEVFYYCYWRAGPYDNGGRRPIEPEWKFMFRRFPGFTFLDSAVVLMKYYWYRTRFVHESGRTGIWHTGQIFTG